MNSLNLTPLWTVASKKNHKNSGLKVDTAVSAGVESLSGPVVDYGVFRRQ
jgi:hypothetical protein